LADRAVDTAAHQHAGPGGGSDGDPTADLVCRPGGERERRREADTKARCRRCQADSGALSDGALGER
jgi:hypothetical protein